MSVLDLAVLLGSLVTTLVAALTFIRGVTNTAALRRKVRELETLQAAESKADHVMAIDSLRRWRSAQLLARQVGPNHWPMTATLGPMAFVTGALGVVLLLGYFAPAGGTGESIFDSPIFFTWAVVDPDFRRGFVPVAAVCCLVLPALIGATLWPAYLAVLRIRKVVAWHYYRSARILTDLKWAPERTSSTLSQAIWDEARKAVSGAALGLALGSLGALGAWFLAGIIDETLIAAFPGPRWAPPLVMQTITLLGVMFGLNQSGEGLQELEMESHPSVAAEIIVPRR